MRLAREHRPDLVLMDIQLPGINGIEALRQLRADPATAAIPVIAVTASVMEQDRRQITQAGFDAYVGKPISLKEFLEAVRASAGRRPGMSVSDRADGDPGRAGQGCWWSTTRRSNVKLLADILGAKGLRVVTAASGEEALAKVAAESPDLVLLDVMMPGLSGYDVLRRLRADPATALLPVVLVTSLDPHEERVKGIEAGADDFLQKPIHQPELMARVRSLLRIKALQDEVKRQAAELAGWNATLEARVQACVAEIERLGRLKRFFSAPVAEAIVSEGEASLLAPHRRDICAAFVDLRGFTAFTERAEPEEVMSVLARLSRGDGPAHRRARRDGAALRGRRHAGVLQRSDAVGRTVRRRRAHGARDAGSTSFRSPRAGASSATSSVSASASRAATRRSAPSATRAGSTTRRSAASSISPRACAARRRAGRRWSIGRPLPRWRTVSRWSRSRRSR